VALPIEAYTPERKAEFAAIATRCSYLLTGGQTHFGPWFGKRIGGVRILRPAEFLAAQGEP
jgi:hypothetical protein